jgi:1-acyl-sn-glycerol-3-phosphate acyltransferase
MKKEGNLFGKIWRCWYYILAGLFVMPLFPILYVLALRDAWFSGFAFFAKIWSRFLVHGMGFGINVTYESEIPKGQYIVCPNHSSYLDIPLLLSVIKFPIKFIGKAELGKIPLFGTLYKRTAVLVDRSSMRNRKNALTSAMETVKKGHSMCFFPEGRIPDDEEIVLDAFKNGAFTVAIEQQIPIIPVTFVNIKRLYPSRTHKGRPGILRAIVHKPISTVGMDRSDSPALKKQVRDIILETLEKDGSN